MKSQEFASARRSQIISTIPVILSSPRSANNFYSHTGILAWEEANYCLKIGRFLLMPLDLKLEGGT